MSGKAAACDVQSLYTSITQSRCCTCLPQAVCLRICACKRLLATAALTVLLRLQEDTSKKPRKSGGPARGGAAKRDRATGPVTGALLLPSFLLMLSTLC